MPDSHWLKDAQIELHILNVSSYMNQSVKELGKQQQAKLNALICQKEDMYHSMRRDMATHRYIQKTALQVGILCRKR